MKGISLPSETLSEIFRWLDRRTLETKIRLVSHRTNAIVCTLMPKVPHMPVDEIAFCPGNDYATLQIVFCRKPPFMIFPRQPFDVCEVRKIPMYVKASIATLMFMVSDNCTTPDRTKEVSDIQVNYKKRDGTDVMHYCFFFCRAVLDPSGKNAVSFVEDIMSRRWTLDRRKLITTRPEDRMHFAFMYTFTLFQSMRISLDGNYFPRYIEWLMECANGDRVTDAHVAVDLIFPAVLDFLVEDFLLSSRPRQYHLRLLDVDTTEIEENQWKNYETKETFTLRLVRYRGRRDMADMLRSVNPCTDCKFQDPPYN